MKDRSKKRTITSSEIVVAVSLNIFSAIGTIFLNKFLFKYYGFKFATLLTVCHFYVIFAILVACVYGKIFVPKRLSIIRVLPISLAFSGYVVFNNLSLQYNSVSFYQVMKIFCTPFIILIEYYVYGVATPRRVQYSLIPVCIGIFLSTITDFEINLVGTVYACLAIVANSLYTIWGKRKVKALDAGPLQVLFYNSIMSGIMLTFALPYLDHWMELKSFVREDLSFSCVFFVFASCLTAFFVNFSFFLSVGKTSPLTMNAVGYFKTCVVFFGGITLFTEEYSLQNLAGIIITLLGLAWYTLVKYQITEMKKKKSLLPTD